MQEGLYKVEMHTVHGSRRGVIYVWDGKMMGGNSAFAFIGTYRDGENDEVLVDISSMRHNDDPKFQPLFKVDKITLSLTGRRRGDAISFRRRHYAIASHCLQLGDDPDQRSGGASRPASRKRRDRKRSLLHSHPDA